MKSFLLKSTLILSTAVFCPVVIAQDSRQDRIDNGTTPVWAEQGGRSYYCPGHPKYGKGKGEHVNEEQARAAGYGTMGTSYGYCGQKYEARAECTDGRKIHYFLHRDASGEVRYFTITPDMNGNEPGHMTRWPAAGDWACKIIKEAESRKSHSGYGCRTSDFIDPVANWHPINIKSLCEAQRSARDAKSNQALKEARKKPECLNLKKQWDQVVAQDGGSITIASLQTRAQLEVAATMQGCGNLKESW